VKRVEVLNPVVGICHMRVCVKKDATDEEILEVCNSENPSGTTSGWTTVRRLGTPEVGGPIPCADDPSRLHLMVSC